jgi:hypothetical protein
MRGGSFSCDGNSFGKRLLRWIDCGDGGLEPRGMAANESGCGTRFGSPARTFGFSTACCVETEATNGKENVVPGFDIDRDESARSGETIVGEFFGTQGGAQKAGVEENI